MFETVGDVSVTKPPTNSTVVVTPVANVNCTCLLSDDTELSPAKTQDTAMLLVLYLGVAFAQYMFENKAVPLMVPSVVGKNVTLLLLCDGMLPSHIFRAVTFDVFAYAVWIGIVANVEVPELVMRSGTPLITGNAGGNWNV
jgi:hypothetical protein